MSMLTRTLFGRRPSARRNTAPTDRRSTRLAAEQLDDRVMLSVTPTLSAGVLRIDGNAANDSVRVFHPTSGANTDFSRIDVHNFLTETETSFTASQVNRIELYGNDGDDWLNNDTAKPGVFYGGIGNDQLDGGSGSDAFHASAGTDAFYGRGGRDVLHRNGHRGYFADGNTTDHDMTIGLVPAGTRLTADELRAQGDLTVAMNGNRLEFTGPSGAGFALRSDWGNGGSQFKSGGSVTLETYYGDLTLPSVGGGPVLVELDGQVMGNAGSYESISWRGIPVTGTTNPLNGILDQATGGIGLDVNLPGLTWGVGLGSDVKALDEDAPLNDAVPYFYAHLNTGFSLSYSGASVTAPNTYTGTFALSPGDGTVYAAVTGLPVVGDLGVAVSPSGYIPYTPERIPQGQANPNIFGHYYARGAIDLGDAGLPVEVSGNVVVDLDANDNGQLIGLNATNVRQAVSQFITGIVSPNGLRNTSNAIVNDMAVGFNGGLALSVSVLSLDLGSASAWYRPGQVAFRAATTNPFDGIPVLEQLGTGGGTFDVQGYVNWTPGSSAAPDWWFKGTTTSSNFGGLSAASLYLEAGNSILGGGGIRAGASVNGLMGAGQISVNGVIGFDGSVSLSGSVIFSDTVNWGTFHAGVMFTGTMNIGWNATTRTFTFGGSVYASAWAELEGIGSAGVMFRADLAITITGGQMSFRAAGSVTIWVDLVIAPRAAFTVGFVLTNDSFSLQLPGLEDVTFYW